MLPRSPPLPFTHRTCFVFPSTGSTWASFELVFPPPKFVILRSDPNRFERYRSNSGSSRFEAAASSQRSSRKRRPLFPVIACRLYPHCFECRRSFTPIHHSTQNINTATISNTKNKWESPQASGFPQRDGNFGCDP